MLQASIFPSQAISAQPNLIAPKEEDPLNHWLAYEPDGEPISPAIGPVLVTGITGLLGSFIAKELLEEGYKVHGLKRKNSPLTLVADLADRINWQEGELTDLGALEDAIRPCPLVVHCAALVSFLPSEAALLHQTNLEGTRNVVNTCLDLGVRKLLFISSVAALGGNGKGEVVNEGAKWPGLGPSSTYGLTKYLAELEVWRGLSEGLRIAILNPSVVLGPGLPGKGGSSALFSYVAKGKPFYGPGTMNYVDVRDVALASRLSLEQLEGERLVLNAGALPFQAFFEQVAGLLGKPAPKYPITPLLAQLAWRVEAIKYRVTGQRPLVTKETARNAFRKTVYDGNLATQRLGLRYRSLADSLQYSLTGLREKGLLQVP